MIARDPGLSFRFLAPKAAGRNSGPYPTAQHRFDMFWARNAICHALRLLDVSLGSTVLLPSYVCTTVPEAVIAFGAKMEFYRVTSRCEADIDDIERRGGPAVSAMLVLHYFGVPQPGMARLREFRDHRGLVLVEDCAHLLPGADLQTDIGSLGHCCVFSWRKFLPVYDGATLVVNREIGGRAVQLMREPSVFTLKVIKDVIDRWVPLRGLRMPMAWLRRRVRQAAEGEAIGVLRESSPTPAQIDWNCDHFVETLAGFPMSRVSRWIRDTSDFHGIAATRRRNWQFLTERNAGVVNSGSLASGAAGEGLPVGVPIALRR